MIVTHDRRGKKHYHKCGLFHKFINTVVFLAALGKFDPVERRDYDKKIHEWKFRHFIFQQEP